MATALEVSREFTYRQAAKMAAGQNVIKEISMAKNFATDTADRITTDAVQILGGLGYMRESLVERLYRDNRILSIGGGTLIAAANLIRRMGARVHEAAAIIDLPELGGSQRLEDMGIPTFCLTQFALADK